MPPVCFGQHLPAPHDQRSTCDKCDRPWIVRSAAPHPLGVNLLHDVISTSAGQQEALRPTCRAGRTERSGPAIYFTD
jgi:hypothetical protein